MAAVIGCVNTCGCDVLFLLFPCVSFSVTGPILTLYTAYYPLVSSDTGINQDFVLFVESGIQRGVLQSMLTTFLFMKRERSCFCFQPLPVHRAQVSGVSQNSADNTIVHCLCRASPPPLPTTHSGPVMS